MALGASGEGYYTPASLTKVAPVADTVLPSYGSTQPIATERDLSNAAPAAPASTAPKIPQIKNPKWKAFNFWDSSTWAQVPEYIDDPNYIASLPEPAPLPPITVPGVATTIPVAAALPMPEPVLPTSTLLPDQPDLLPDQPNLLPDQPDLLPADTATEKAAGAVASVILPEVIERRKQLPSDLVNNTGAVDTRLPSDLVGNTGASYPTQLPSGGSTQGVLASTQLPSDGSTQGVSASTPLPSDGSTQEGKALRANGQWMTDEEWDIFQTTKSLRGNGLSMTNDEWEAWLKTPAGLAYLTTGGTTGGGTTGGGTTGPKVGDTQTGADGKPETWNGTEWVKSPDEAKPPAKPEKPEKPTDTPPAGKEYVFDEASFTWKLQDIAGWVDPKVLADKVAAAKAAGAPAEKPKAGFSWSLNEATGEWEQVAIPGYDPLKDKDNTPTDDPGKAMKWEFVDGVWKKVFDVPGSGSAAVGGPPTDQTLGVGKMWSYDPLTKAWSQINDPSYTPPKPDDSGLPPGSEWEYDPTSKTWNPVEKAEVGARRAAEISAGAARSQAIGAGLATGQSASAAGGLGAQQGSGQYAESYKTVLETLTGAKTQRQLQNMISSTSTNIAKMNNLTELEVTKLNNDVTTFINELTATVNLAGQANELEIAKIAYKYMDQWKKEGADASFIQMVGQGILALLPGVAEWLGPIFGIPGFAKGVTNFSGGQALVGEDGPEVVNLPPGSDVIPNPRTARFADTRVKSPINDPSQILDHVAGIARQVRPRPAGQAPMVGQQTAARNVDADRMSRALKYLGGM